MRIFKAAQCWQRGSFPRGFKRLSGELDPQPTAGISAMVLEVLCQPHSKITGPWPVLSSPPGLLEYHISVMPAAAASLAPRCQHLVPFLQLSTTAGSLLLAGLSSPLLPVQLLSLPQPCGHTDLCPSAPALWLDAGPYGDVLNPGRSSKHCLICNCAPLLWHIEITGSAKPREYV